MQAAPSSPLPGMSPIASDQVRAIANAADQAAVPHPAVRPDSPQGAAKPKPRPPRLKFRSSDGTCACTCASGGTSEADIQKAQEARDSR